ncbi:MAG: hypothetical protein K9J16_16875 [Melioribacteraceae bacterium]|nr:hypothetical protein [Melioribacteraceae bacterium]MCF8356509.1 hypothetical protein [Melioribacteraceae bacterium]MCF8395896.1 hypothetical protein [Melioribacteraceae bacterium]MCF8420940.1 hypothetical protein [Melioribacteraceae bacterium]
MLPEIKKYAREYQLSINTVLASEITKADDGNCESCEFTRPLYSVPFANYGNGARLCLGCAMTALTEDADFEKRDDDFDD